MEMGVATSYLEYLKRLGKVKTKERMRRVGKRNQNVGSPKRVS